MVGGWEHEPWEIGLEIVWLHHFSGMVPRVASVFLFILFSITLKRLRGDQGGTSVTKKPRGGFWIDAQNAPRRNPL